MGKLMGFMEYDRKQNSSEKPLERIKNFNEFHPMLSRVEREKQGARCMDCGSPFCQSAMTLSGMVSGCPLHNLIPEWNDELYNGNWSHALARLTKTASFPEFTGRVCPALCEVSCTCGLNDSPVTVRENELAIIENGYKKGLVKPRIPKVRSGKKVAVIGSGPSGLACADLLNRRGHSVTVFEKDDRPGGLLMYGIPNMKLDKNVIERRVSLMKAEGVAFSLNSDIGTNVGASEILEEYDAVVLCCGAGNPRDLKFEGREKAKNVYFAVDFLKATTKSLLDSNLKDGNYISTKNKNVVIVGGGDTGNDCVGTAIRHGCKSVVQIEMMPKAPDSRLPSNPWPEWPKVCKTEYGQEEAIAVFGKDPRVYCTTVKKVVTDEKDNLTSAITVKLEAKKDEKTGRMIVSEIEGSEKEIKADMIIIAAGFLGCRKYIADAFGVNLNERTNIKTELGKYCTNVEKVFTAGDMHRGQSLVVWAISEGRNAAKEVDEYLMGYTNLI